MNTSSLEASDSTEQVRSMHTAQNAGCGGWSSAWTGWLTCDVWPAESVTVSVTL